MNLDLWHNLVNVVFVHPIFFAIILIAIISYYSIVYDIPHWAFGLFSSLFISWLAIELVGIWLLIPILIGTAFFVAIQIFRRIRN